ncbi:MAG: sensor histidine kinase, partial [Pirellulales bacterium]
ALELDGRPQALDLVRRIEHAHDHLIQLYEDLRGYAAPVVMHRDVQNVSDIVLDAWNSLLSLHKDRVVRLIGNQEHGAVYCAVDRSRLEQVFRNILENALAACADPVEITWRLSEAEAEDGRVIRIVLADNGPGLSDEQRQRLFDPFYTTKSNGTGLGMPICKQIVEAHGGGIAVENLPGRGAKFIITLPNADVPRRANEQRQNAKSGEPHDVRIRCGACGGS